MTRFWRKLEPQSIVPIFLRLIVSTVCVAIFFVLTQDFHIFPGLYGAVIFNQKSTAPAGIELIEIPSRDGTLVRIWRNQADNTLEKDSNQAPIALLFHGNGESLHAFLAVQRWLASGGITSYSVEYRGYFGRYSGWPSEAGLYEDAEAAHAYASRRENISDARRFLILGNSIGTGIASYTAQKFQTGALLLLSPYSRFQSLVKEQPLVGYLSPFVRYSFPTEDYVKYLTGACVIITHATNDSIIGFHHATAVEQAARHANNTKLIADPKAHHNSILRHTHKQVFTEITRCSQLWSQPLQ